MKLRLNDNYPQDFFSLQSGQIFYRKENKFNKEVNSHDIDPKNFEAQQMIKQGILIPEEIKVSPKLSQAKGLNTTGM